MLIKIVSEFIATGRPPKRVENGGERGILRMGNCGSHPLIHTFGPRKHTTACWDGPNEAILCIKV
jgi:hypothetical protein